MTADNKFQFLLEKIYRNKGVDFSLYREGTLRRRIDSRLRTTGCVDYLEYVSYLNRNPEEYDRLIKAVTINVTEFFRNPETFRAIQQKVLPEIIKQKQEHSVIGQLQGGVDAVRQNRGLPFSRTAATTETLSPIRLYRIPPVTEGLQHSKKTIRAWCAGASYGEEAYSVAILFLQVLQKKNADYDVKILGTDIDPDCIVKAKIGLYEPSHLKAIGKHILDRYFSREGKNYRVNDAVRQLTEFKPHNMLSDKPFDKLDLILCRNVIIYFTKPLQTYVYNLFARCLKPGGFLVLGKVESLWGCSLGLFETVDNKERIYRKVNSN
ncbi:MAG: protein-glutamate O-methyltransferase CheR [Verrucomicrobia bacterium]|nr:protein-glutamate O-methyltransferase CheR [Verrucomicrobiota bacterium]MBU1735586.1 protein-glutamate O-methyltransferase CheR [Verrucomicrobiota bacterium]